MYYDYCFSNASEFQEFFGLKDYGNGSVSRKNKILLAVLKSKSFRDYSRAHGLQWYKLSCMGALREFIEKELNSNFANVCIADIGLRLHSNEYRTDSFQGYCADEDQQSIRYVLLKTGRVYKMRAGKFLMRIHKEHEFFNALPKEAQNWYIEQLVRRLLETRAAKLSENRLVVDDNFEFIYRRENFGSCMANMNQWSFYQDAVPGAKAAYLIDENDRLVARCIIFSAKDDNGKVWRLAERQYAYCKDESLKRELVIKLIAGGYIDGYKRLGAGCGDASAFDAINGTPLDDVGFEIECNLEDGDTLSYQDSFKWYDHNTGIAYNYPASCATDELDRTDSVFHGEYDDYHECYCRETTAAIYEGREIAVDIDNLDDFVWCGSEDMYIYFGEVERCPECDEVFYTGNGNYFYSELTEEYYDCESCMDKAELRYKEENWYYSDYDGDYYEDEDDIVELGDGSTISNDSLNYLLERGRIAQREDGVFEFV